MSGAGWFRRARAAGCALLLAAAVVAAACGSRAGLDGGLASPEAVAEAVLAALDARDTATLERLVVNEREFRELVWPRQPAARPERNVPWDYAWRSLAAKSRHQLRGRLAEWTRSGAARVVAVHFGGDTTDYGDYRIHRRSMVTVRDASGGQRTLRLFGSIIEQDGRFKVFSYVVD